ncbi:phosphate transport system regulatory protein PhoU [Methanocella sp. CWC-04]|uniref:Phosphate-specific transport system accessory protein PhoU n=1 Tax=Methanooceanicella nereidis TaxID=2052831 RepID=A0AAP2REI9_9EURY|nr:phosphate signaling complex protein PhoU [Methanocella sp. CWC-04]MCD1295717.1 phosphate transport system regulatory protein PhoU [Methanocella sp. CWC-04]
MTREYYFQQIKGLGNDLLKMGEDSLELLSLSIKALESRDVEMAKRVMERSGKISEMELELEHNCVEILALQQPMASDLRFITSTLKILTDLERLSRLAYDIGAIVVKIGDEPLLPEIKDIRRMYDLAESMMTDSIHAFVNRDLEMARNMGARDDEVDAMYDHVRRELIEEMIKDPKATDMASHLSFVSRYIERCADHACVIAARTVYMVTGERLKIR